MQPTWRVSTLSRKLGSAIAIAGFAGLVIGALAHGGDPNKRNGGSAADALFAPSSLAIASIAMAVTAAYLWWQSSRLEGGPDWIRRVRPSPPVTIQVAEVVRVTRQRPSLLGIHGKPAKQIAALSFTLATADGRTITVAEAGVHREPKLVELYERSLAAAVEATARAIAAGTPYDAGTVALDGGGLVWPSGARMPLAQIAQVIIEVDTSTEVTIIDRMQRPGAALPDDELLHRTLARLGVPVTQRRART